MVKRELTEFKRAVTNGQEHAGGNADEGDGSTLSLPNYVTYLVQPTLCSPPHATYPQLSNLSSATYLTLPTFPEDAVEVANCATFVGSRLRDEIFEGSSTRGM